MSEENWLFNDSWWYERDDLVEPFEWDSNEVAERVYGAFDAGKIDDSQRQELIEELYFGDTFRRDFPVLDYGQARQASKYVLYYVNKENYAAGHRITKDTWYEPTKRPEDYAWDRKS